MHIYSSTDRQVDECFDKRLLWEEITGLDQAVAFDVWIPDLPWDDRPFSLAAFSSSQWMLLTMTTTCLIRRQPLVSAVQRRTIPANRECNADQTIMHTQPDYNLVIEEP